jgi:uncharacterized protein YchJ
MTSFHCSKGTPGVRLHSTLLGFEQVDGSNCADGPSLYRYALMLLADPAAAEDAVQQVFTSVLRSRASARLEADERYLRRAIRNECYSMLRRRRIRPIQLEPHVLLEQIAEASGASSNTVAARYRYVGKAASPTRWCET